jgi:hypothetical protein
LKLWHDEPPSRFAFKFKLRRYSKAEAERMLRDELLVYLDTLAPVGPAKQCPLPHDRM